MCETPKKNTRLDRTPVLKIPPSPFLQKLGYGTSITVYKLDRSPSRSPWALKKTSRHGKSKAEMNIRLKFEASILRTLNHPNIVGFRALFTEADGRKCLAMEECCISLGDLIEKRVEDGNSKPFDAHDIERVACQVAEGLRYLHHETLILHCDIKSYNILIKYDFKICKICDFGVSMPLKPDGTIDYDKAGTDVDCAGTPSWWPPELFKEPQVITCKIDIYSYGLTLWEMMALQPPFAPNEDTENTIDSVYSVEEDSDEESEESDDQNLANRRRPEIPCEYLDDSYSNMLQIYVLCTEFDHKKRPNANELCLVLKNQEDDH